MNAAFRETAVSVGDKAMGMSHYLAAKMPKAELAHLGAALIERQMAVRSSAAVIVARPHSRGQSNEQISKGLIGRVTKSLGSRSMPSA